MAKQIVQETYEIKKELILHHATILFEKNGYDNMKISELAKNVGVSQSTIYSLFENKSGLYLEYFKLQIKNFLEELSQLTLNSTAYEKLNKYIALKFTYHLKREKIVDSNIKNNPFFFNIFYNEDTDPIEGAYQFLSNAFLEYDPTISQNKATKLAYTFNSFSDGYISLWLGKQNVDLLASTDEICTSFLSIIKTIK